MVVISINDRGNERNFVVANISVAGGCLLTTIAGKIREFPLAQVISIIAVTDHVESLGVAGSRRI